MTLAPHELRFGRLLMVAFLLIFLHRVLATALAPSGTWLVVLAGLVLGIAAVYSWFLVRWGKKRGRTTSPCFGGPVLRDAAAEPAPLPS